MQISNRIPTLKKIRRTTSNCSLGDRLASPGSDKKSHKCRCPFALKPHQQYFQQKRSRSKSFEQNVCVEVFDGESIPQTYIHIRTYRTYVCNVYINIHDYIRIDGFYPGACSLARLGTKIRSPKHFLYRLTAHLLQSAR